MLARPDSWRALRGLDCMDVRSISAGMAAAVLLGVAPIGAQAQRFFARQRLAAEGSASTVPATDPSPEMPSPPDDPQDNDQMADYIRKTGAYVHQMVARSSGGAMNSLAEIGSPKFDYKGRVSSFDFAEVGYDRNRVYRVVVPSDLCNAIRRRMGQPEGFYEITPASEACGYLTSSGNFAYLMPIDDVLRPKQVQNVQRTVEVVKAAALASDNVDPKTLADVGSPAVPLGNLGGAPYFDYVDRTVRIRIDGFDMGLCNYMRKQSGRTGWPAAFELDSSIPQDCGYYAGAYSILTDISGPMGAKQVAKLRDAAAILRGGLAKTGYSSPTAYADAGSPDLALGSMLKGEPSFAPNNGLGTWTGKIPVSSYAVCDSVRRALGTPSTSKRFEVDQTQTEDCGYDTATGVATYVFRVDDVVDANGAKAGGAMAKDMQAVADGEKDADGRPAGRMKGPYPATRAMGTSVIITGDGYYVLVMPFSAQDSISYATCLSWERVNGRSSGEFSYSYGRMACHYVPYYGGYGFYRVVGRY